MTALDAIETLKAADPTRSYIVNSGAQYHFAKEVGAHETSESTISCYRLDEIEADIRINEPTLPAAVEKALAAIDPNRITVEIVREATPPF